MSNTLKTHLHFLWAALVKQQQMGAIIPSQKFLINRMIAPVPEDYRGQIIELGAGSGALTQRLAARCRGARILACEINRSLARVNRSNLAAAAIDANRVEVVADSAENLLPKLCRNSSDKPDFIISGIPLGNLPGEKALAIIEAVKETLRPGGLFIQFQYFLADRRKIRKRFARMRTIPVLLNFPPRLRLLRAETSARVTQTGSYRVRFKVSVANAAEEKRQRAAALHDAGAFFGSASNYRRFWSAAALCRFLS